MTDEQLLERFVAQHEAAAFEELVRRHGPMVWRVCRRVLHNAQDAEDAFQATFIVLVRRGASIAKREAVGSWLYGVASRIALQTRDSANRARATGQGIDQRALEGAAGAGQPGPEDREVRAVLDEELNRLPEKYRTPLVLCYLEGKTTEETAQQLGCPKGTILWRLAQGKERLRTRLTRRGLGLSAVALGAVLVQSSASAAPAGLATATVKAAALTAAGKAVGAGVLSTKAGSLANAALKAMFWAKVKTSAATVAAVVTLAVVPASLLLPPKADGLVGHYAFAEGQGTRAGDASPRANHGTLVGGVNWIAGRKPGSKALNFDGVSGHVQLARDVAPWLTGTATVACWILTTQVGNTDTSSPAILRADVLDDSDVVWGWLDAAGRIGVGAGSGPVEHGGQPSAMSKQPINDGRWHHVAMTRNAANGEVRMYVDGVFQATTISGIGSKAAPLPVIGRFASEHNQAMYYFRGALSDLRLYSRLLTAEEIRRLAQ